MTKRKPVVEVWRNVETHERPPFCLFKLRVDSENEAAMLIHAINSLDFTARLPEDSDV